MYAATAGLAYDTARAASRFAAKKNAHDEVLSAVYRAQADALDIEAQAKRRLADEYDAAQERGEVQKHGHHAGDVLDRNITPAVADLGLTRGAIYDARIVRDAEAADPGIVRRLVSAPSVSGFEQLLGNRCRHVREGVYKCLWNGWKWE